MAQAFPSCPIRIVVSYTLSSGSDIFASPVAPFMAKSLKKTMVIDNKCDAAGNIGAQQVATSTADGYTLLQANNSQVINPFTCKKAGYESPSSCVALTLAPVPL